MNAAELVDGLRRRNIVLTITEDGRMIDIDAPESELTPDVLDVLRARKPEVLAVVWDAEADAIIASTLARVGKLHDEIGPGCSLDTPAWDRVEAVVNAAYSMRNRQALTDALDVYEHHARAAFEAWQTEQAAKAAKPSETRKKARRRGLVLLGARDTPC